MTFVGMALLVIGLWTFPILKGWTTLYQCLNASETTVFTDSPAQLTNCMALDPETLAPKTDVPQRSTPLAGENERPILKVLSHRHLPILGTIPQRLLLNRSNMSGSLQTMKRLRSPFL